MNELLQLQKLREIGCRLAELHLLQLRSEQSYAGATLQFLCDLYQVKRPTGTSLANSLQLLANAVNERYPLALRRYHHDSILEFFCRYFAVRQPTVMPLPMRRYSTESHSKAPARSELRRVSA
jgi:hypothetical protein